MAGRDQHEREPDLALRLIQQLTVRFDPLNYFDRYRHSVQALVRSRIAGQQTIAAADTKATDAGSLLTALEQSLQPKVRKPSTAEGTSAKSAPDRKPRRRAAS